MRAATRKRARATRVTSKTSGPDIHISRLRDLFDAQLRMEDTLEKAEGDDIILALERNLDKGTIEITNAMNDYLRRPFSGKNRSFTITDKQRLALRELRAAVTEELQDPSDSKKEQLKNAVESLVRAFDTTDDNSDDVLEWEPKRFRVLDPSHPKFDPDYSSSSDEEIEKPKVDENIKMEQSN